MSVQRLGKLYTPLSTTEGTSLGNVSSRFEISSEILVWWASRGHSKAINRIASLLTELFLRCTNYRGTDCDVSLADTHTDRHTQKSIHRVDSFQVNQSLPSPKWQKMVWPMPLLAYREFDYEVK